MVSEWDIWHTRGSRPFCDMSGRCGHWFSREINDFFGYPGVKQCVTTRNQHVENFRRIAQVTSCVAMVTANCLRVELNDFDAKWKTYSAITMFELTSCNFYVWETLILGMFQILLTSSRMRFESYSTCSARMHYWTLSTWATSDSTCRIRMYCCHNIASISFKFEWT